MNIYHGWGDVDTRKTADIEGELSDRSVDMAALQKTGPYVETASSSRTAHFTGMAAQNIASIKCFVRHLTIFTRC